MNRIKLAFILLLIIAAGCDKKIEEKEYSRVGMVMNTFVQVRAARGDLSMQQLERAVDSAFTFAGTLISRFDAYDPGSEVNTLNLDGKTRVSSELLKVLSKAVDISRLTGGAFDVTISPVLKQQGFYADMPEELLSVIPSDDRGVGWKNIIIDAVTGEVFLDNGAWVDLSGVAKGYVVDRMAEELREYGVRHVLVNAGGDVYCGRKESGEKWTIGIRHPGTGRVSLILSLTEGAVATSGDYENFVTDEKSGEEKSHIVDPYSRVAMKKKNSSVTVIAQDCSEADALATGLIAMGPGKGIALAESVAGVDVIYIFENNGKEEVIMSEGARKYVLDM